MIDNVFSIEEIIWGKLRGYPPWPGKIIENLGNKKYKIIFFGEDSFATLPKENIFHFNTISTQTKNKKLLQAINEAKEELQLKGEEQDLSQKTHNNTANVTKGQDNFKIILSLNNSESLLDEDEEINDNNKNNNDDILIENNDLTQIIQLDEINILEISSQSDVECQCFLSRKSSRGINNIKIEEGIIQHMINYLLCLALEYQKNLRKKINREEEKCLTKIFKVLRRKLKSEASLESLKNAKVDVLIQYILSKIQNKELIQLGICAYTNIQFQRFGQVINNE